MNLCMTCAQPVSLHGLTWQHDEDGSQACIVNGLQNIIAVADPNEHHCDFCNSTDVHWKLVTKGEVGVDIIVYDDDFTVQGTQTQNMSPDWAACNECHDLIEAGNWRAVAEKAVAGLMLPRPMLREAIDSIMEMHAAIQPDHWVHEPTDGR